MKNTASSLYVVVGAGLSGMAAVRLLRHKGEAVRLLDKKPLPADFARWAADNAVDVRVGEHREEDFADAAVVVPSPGVAAAGIRALFSVAHHPEIIAETELAFRELTTEKVLAVTGTSGKTTTTSLAAAMLTAQGLRVFTGGNIGTPLSEYALRALVGEDRVDVVALELSSFQLQTCSTLRPHVGVLLNISPNHLDYHADMAEYIEAKMRLFVHQTADHTAIMGADVAHLAGEFQVQSRVVVPKPSTRFQDMQLFGTHNQANAEAAFLAVRELGVTEEAAQRAVAAFKPLEHRLERVTEQNGVLYVNDSKCTTVDALRVALNAFSRPVLLLAGGKFKGGDLPGLQALVQDKTRHVALYGASREHFEQAWQGLSLSWDETLEQAMRRLQGMARKNDVILLAPATASYDQYVNYLARGDEFKRLALELSA